MKKNDLEGLIVDYKKGKITTSNGKTVCKLHPMGKPIMIEITRSWPPHPLPEKNIKYRRITDFTEEHYGANAFIFLHDDCENDSSAFRRTGYLAVQFYKIGRKKK